MKTDRRRLIADTYPVRFDCRILYADMDGFRHVNNGATGRYFEEGRASFNARIFGIESLTAPAPGRQILFANITVDFLREGRYPGSVEIATGCSKIGSSSYTLAQAAFQNGECFALSNTIVVKSVDGASQPLDATERAAIAALMLASA